MAQINVAHNKHRIVVKLLCRSKSVKSAANHKYADNAQNDLRSHWRERKERNEEKKNQQNFIFFYFMNSATRHYCRYHHQPRRSWRTKIKTRKNIKYDSKAWHWSNQLPQQLKHTWAKNSPRREKKKESKKRKNSLETFSATTFSLQGIYSVAVCMHKF